MFNRADLFEQFWSFKEHLSEIVLAEVVSSFFSIYSSGIHLVHQSRTI